MPGPHCRLFCETRGKEWTGITTATEFNKETSLIHSIFHWMISTLSGVKTRWSGIGFWWNVSFFWKKKKKKRKTSPWCALENLFNLMKLCRVGSSHLSFKKLYFFFSPEFSVFFSCCQQKAVPKLQTTRRGKIILIDTIHIFKETSAVSFAPYFSFCCFFQEKQETQ